MLRIATTFWLFQGIFGLSSISAFAQSAGVDVVITTSSGDIRVNVDTVRAPVTAANFLRYVDGDLYADGAFFRTVRAGNQPEDSVRIAVVQGGASSDNRDAFFDPVPLERTSETGLTHVDGAISMARAGPDTATHSFFICIGDQPELDFGGRRNPDGQGFAAFGVVTSGMDVVRAVHRSPADGQSLSQPIRILNITRE